MADPAVIGESSGPDQEGNDDRLSRGEEPHGTPNAGAGALIVLDTNVLDTIGFPDGAVLTMLRRLAEHRDHTLALPEMVVIEHVAHHQHTVQQALSAARNALEALQTAFDQPFTETLDGLKDSDAAFIRRGLLRRDFSVLATPDGAALAALEREANRLPPAEATWVSEGKRAKARGARDVVIWLTLLDAAERHPGEVWFVSADGDFAQDGDLHPALRDEAVDRLGQERANRLRLLRGVDKLLLRLADKADLQHTTVETLLASTPVAAAVTEFLNGPTAFFSLSSRVLPHAPGGSFLSSVAAVVTFDRRLGKPHAYRVGERVWVTARARWRAAKTFLQLTADSLASAEGQVVTERRSARVHFGFTATVLMELDAEGAEVLGATVLAIGPLELRGSDDMAGDTDE